MNVAAKGRGVNGYAGSPPMVGLSPFVECTVECVGEPDPTSGYLINIKAIDDAVHGQVRPLVEETCCQPPPHAPHRLPSRFPTPDLGRVLSRALAGLGQTLPVEVVGLALGLSPYHAVSMKTEPSPNSPVSSAAATPANATVSLRFDFAASHRLHVTAWDDRTNREFFGKCNNPNGHGHNYRLEVRVTVPPELLGRFPTDALERVVHETVITRFDHTHLNLDTEEFADDGGLNPTVENITRVCHDLLSGPVLGLGDGVKLRSVRVWETDRTSSEYPA